MQEIVSFLQAKNDDQVDSFVMLLDVLSRMVVTAQADWAEPITEMLKAPDLAGAGAFTSQPLMADPRGWQGQGRFAKAEEAVNREWNGSRSKKRPALEKILADLSCRVNVPVRVQARGR